MQTITCPKCEGSGTTMTALYGVPQVCPRCDGTGYVKCWHPAKAVLLLALLLTAAFFATSCTKDVVSPTHRQTIITTVMQHDSDNMPTGFAFNCYPSDKRYQYDSDWVYTGVTPDTLRLKNYLRMDSHIATGRVDSSFMYAGTLVSLVGVIEHREYTFVAGIKKISLGTIQ